MRTYIRDNRGRFARNPNKESVMRYTFESEGRVDGIEYVTVLDEGGNPVEYNIPRERAEREYGDPATRLEYLRGEIRAERISQGEVIELQGLAEYIDPGDVELLEWAGVPEFPDDQDESDDDGPAAWPSWAPTDEPEEPAKTYRGVPGMLDIPAGEVQVGDFYDGHEVMDIESYGPDYDRDVRFIVGPSYTNTGNIPAGRMVRVQRPVLRDDQVVKVRTPAASFDLKGKHVGPGRWLDLVRKVNGIEPGTLGSPLKLGAQIDGYEYESAEVYTDAYVVHVNRKAPLEDQYVVVFSRTPRGARLIRQAADALGLHYEIEG
jgi:hypothetical protein